MTAAHDELESQIKAIALRTQKLEDAIAKRCLQIETDKFLPISVCYMRLGYRNSTHLRNAIYADELRMSEGKAPNHFPQGAIQKRGGRWFVDVRAVMEARA